MAVCSVAHVKIFKLPAPYIKLCPCDCSSVHPFALVMLLTHLLIPHLLSLSVCHPSYDYAGWMTQQCIIAPLITTFISNTHYSSDKWRDIRINWKKFDMRGLWKYKYFKFSQSFIWIYTDYCLWNSQLSFLIHP